MEAQIAHFAPMQRNERQPVRISEVLKSLLPSRKTEKGPAPKTPFVIYATESYGATAPEMIEERVAEKEAEGYEVYVVTLKNADQLAHSVYRYQDSDRNYLVLGLQAIA